MTPTAEGIKNLIALRNQQVARGMFQGEVLGGHNVCLQLYYSFELELGFGVRELQIPFDFAEGRLFASLGGCDFLISLVVCGRKAWKSICQQTSPGSFDSAP